MRDLQFAISNMKKMLASDVERLDFDEPDPEATLWVCSLARRIGVGALLADGDAAQAFEGLFRSGEMFLMLLEPLAARGDMTEVSRAHAHPMTDALAAGAIELGRRIDALLPVTRNPDLEDDEDFAWYSTFHGLAVGRLDPGALRETGARFVGSDSDYLAPRGELVAALADGKAVDFDRALARITDGWHERIQALREGGVADRYADLTEWNLFLEGVALVRAARARGVRVQRMYPFIPAALLVESPPLPEPLSAEA